MTLSIFLIIYAIIVIGLFLYAVLNLFHVMRFASLNTPTLVMSLIFVIGFGGILLVSFGFIQTVDWNHPLTIVNSNTFNTNQIKTNF